MGAPNRPEKTMYLQFAPRIIVLIAGLVVLSSIAITPAAAGNNEQDRGFDLLTTRGGDLSVDFELRDGRLEVDFEGDDLSVGTYTATLSGMVDGERHDESFSFEVTPASKGKGHIVTERSVPYPSLSSLTIFVDGPDIDKVRGPLDGSPELPKPADVLVASEPGSR